MKDCLYYQGLISRLIDRELSAEEGEELSAHARECEECRAVYTAFASLSSMIDSELVDPPAELAENVMAEIRRSEVWKKNRRPRHALRRYVAVAASAALVIGAAALVLPRLRHPSKAASSAPEAAFYAAEDASAASTSGHERHVVPGSLYSASDSGTAESAEVGDAPIAVSDSFAAPAAETTKSEQEMIYEAVHRAEEPESVVEIVDVTGQGRGRAIAALLTGTQGDPPSDRTPDRSFRLRFDVDGVSSQVHISVYGERVFFLSLSGEESDTVLADCSWSTLRAKIYY